jgi:hypothetical protein
MSVASSPPGRRGGERARGRGMPRAAIFEEHHFRWPEQPGDPEKDARLPWFWFVDVGEARAYLALFALVNTLGSGIFVSVWILHSRTLWALLVGPATCVWLAYTWLWIGLCRRVRPPLNRRQWFMGGWLNPRVRHCVQLARELVTDRPEDR